MSDTDMELLARYTRQHAEDAFAELVRRHLGLVYFAALRQVRSPQLAEEVAQSTFIKLASHAHRLAPDTILTAWLYQVTRREAIDVVRREASRQLREQIATEMNAMNAIADDWTHIEPLLDEAMHALDDTDRTAVLLRYFENKSLREVGATLGTSDDAAQKRVSRAVERLREFFAKRGVTVGASGLVVVISANAVQAAPIGLAQCLTVAAIAKAAATGASTSTFIPAAIQIMASKKLTTLTVVIALLLLATITATLVTKLVRTHSAGAAPEIQGAWEGVVELPHIAGVSRGEYARSRMVLRFFKTNGSYDATGELIDIGPERLEIARLAYAYPSVRFDAGQNRSYEGTLNPENTGMSGVVRVGDVSLPLLFKRTAAPSVAPKLLADSDYAPRTGSDLQGRWEGILGNGPAAVHVVVKIAEPSTGNFRAELDNLSTAWLGQPMSVICEQREVQLRLASGAGMFEGRINDDASAMVGKWLQAGMKGRAVFTRADQQAR